MDTADLSRRIESLIRTGTVFAVDLASRRCRVKSGDLVTTWCAWLAFRAGSTQSWSPPTIDEQVILLSPSGETSAALVLCGLYSDTHDAPSESGDEHVIAYPDGARIAYDHAKGELKAIGIKTALIEASEQTTIDCPQNTITGNVLVHGTLTVMKLLTYMSGMSGFPGEGGSESQTVIRGPITQEGGSFSTDGDVQAGNISLRHHPHAEHGLGGGITSEALST